MKTKTKVLFFFFLLVALALQGTSFPFSDSIKFTYTYDYQSKPLKIGENSFSALPVEFTCKYSGDKVRYPNPSKLCWKTRVIYKDKIFELRGGQSVRLDENLKVQFTPKAKMEYNSEFERYVYESWDDWTSYFQFTLSGYDFGVDGTSTNQVLQLNSQDKIKISIKNNIATFPKTNAGVWVRPQHGLLERAEGWQEIRMAIDEGVEIYEIPADTTELGEVALEVQPFLEIEADKKIVIPSRNKITIKYKVSSEPHSDSDEVIKPSFFSLIATFLKNLVGWS